MNTADLTGLALDWAVAKIEGREFEAPESFLDYYDEGGMRYSIDWAQGGPIIEREMIDLQPVMRLHTKDVYWRACGAFMSPTPLIAAMRCFVASKMGDEIETPKELT